MKTPQPGRWFGRRPLPRPEEDLEDQGLGFDVDTLLERRKVVSAMGFGALAFTLAACSPAGNSENAASGSLSEIPDETAGPYPGNGSNGPDVLEQSGIVRSDIRTSFEGASATADGVPMELELTIIDMANGNQPFAGVAVYVWHCDRDGGYSMYSTGLEQENYLRGVQISDETGTVRFTSIFPACYTGRWPHVHFEIYPDQDSITDTANAIATSQLALPQKTCNAVYATTGYESSVRNMQGVSLSKDNVFGEDQAVTQLAAVSGSVDAGYLVKLLVPVDTRTVPSGGNAPSGAQPGGKPPQDGQGPGGRPPQDGRDRYTTESSGTS